MSWSTVTVFGSQRGSPIFDVIHALLTCSMARATRFSKVFRMVVPFHPAARRPIQVRLPVLASPNGKLASVKPPAPVSSPPLYEVVSSSWSASTFLSILQLCWSAHRNNSCLIFNLEPVPDLIIHHLRQPSTQSFFFLLY